MKLIPRPDWVRRTCAAAAAVVAMSAAATVWGATVMKNPLYGDPAHPNLSGMWNPEYAYFGPPIGDGVKPPGPPAGASPPRHDVSPAHAATHSVVCQAVRRVAQEIRDG